VSNRQTSLFSNMWSA